jgi:hypothetical protein
MLTSALERLYCRAISLIKAHVVNLLRISFAWGRANRPLLAHFLSTMTKATGVRLYFACSFLDVRSHFNSTGTSLSLACIQVGAISASGAGASPLGTPFHRTALSDRARVPTDAEQVARSALRCSLRPLGRRRLRSNGQSRGAREWQGTSVLRAVVGHEELPHATVAIWDFGGKATSSGIQAHRTAVQS